MDWQNKLNDSNKAFINLVWPVIKNVCDGGEIKPVEIIRDNDIAKDLDVLCGIDIWQKISDKGVRGIASRVQFTNKPWNTFTVRKYRKSGHKTEYHKRLEAINSNGKYIYPYLTCQAYVSLDKLHLLSCGVARTKDIFDVVEAEKYINRINSEDSTGFIAINFSDVKDVKIFLLDNPQK